LIHLLDTNIVIARLNGDASVAQRLRALHPEDVALAAPTLAELRFGAACSQKAAANLRRLSALASMMRTLPFNEPCAIRFGDLKASLRSRGLAKSDFDLAIASVALEHDAVLVSHDSAFHDGSIPHLRAEDWLS
jgi:tRNA(fMet)-specific endonuclease VapC